MRFGIQAEGLCKSFRNVKVLRDVTFALEEGLVGVIVGPSGSGKTTLLNVISGLVPPDSGKVFVDGELVESAVDAESTSLHVMPAKRNIGYVFQDYLLFPHMTVFENVAYGLRARHQSEQKVREDVMMVLEAVGLRDLHNKKPGQISGGQMQRVALGRAIVLKPRVLLMDEPLSALDRQTRETLRSELRAVFTQFATTVVYVTHDLDEAFFFGHKIGILVSGRLFPFGTKDEIQKSMSSTTAGFLGFNLLKARFLRSEGQHSVFIATEWNAQVKVTLIQPPQLVPEQDVLLAFSPAAVNLEPTQGPREFAVRTTVSDVREFKDRVQVVLGEPRRTLVSEVSSFEFRHRNLKGGDAVAFSIDGAWIAHDMA